MNQQICSKKNGKIKKCFLKITKPINMQKYEPWTFDIFHSTMKLIYSLLSNKSNSPQKIYKCNKYRALSITNRSNRGRAIFYWTSLNYKKTVCLFIIFVWYLMNSNNNTNDWYVYTQCTRYTRMSIEIYKYTFIFIFVFI